MTRNVLLLLALSVAACTEASGTATFSWSVTSGTADADCPAAPGNWSLRVTSTHPGATFTDLFDCSDMAGAVDLPAGSWTISLTMVDASGRDVSDTVAQTVSIPGNAAIPLGHFEFQFAALDLAWSFRRGSNTVSCSLINGARTVRATSTSGPFVFVDLFNCGDMGGFVGPIPGGTYSVSLDLLDTNGNPLNVQSVTVTNIQTATGRQDTLVPEFVFVFPP